MFMGPPLEIILYVHTHWLLCIVVPCEDMFMVKVKVCL